MREHVTTTPFGRRPLSLGQIATRLQVDRTLAEAGAPGSNHPAAVNKWALFRTLTEIRERIGVSDRTLGVLNALLSFQPETALSLPGDAAGEASAALAGTDPAGPSCDLVVFPSNRALCLRAHGMAEKTLRRHLAALVDAGLILRRDSPNGKRYARKAETGAERFADAFGFDLTPLVARAPEFEAMAEDLRRERRAVLLLKERISLWRRDIAKLIACALDAGLDGPWEDLRRRFMALVTPLRQIRTASALEQLGADLARLRQDVAKILENHVNSQNMTGNDGLDDRHQSNSKSEWTTDLEPTPRGKGPLEEPAVAARDGWPEDGALREPEPAPCPLGLVLEACPDVQDHAGSGRIRTWRDFATTVALIRPMIGISPDAWREAIAVLGEMQAHIVVATILQRSEHSSEAVMAPGGAGETLVNGSPAIRSAGGYLRALTDKARAGDFALGPVLMALIGQRLKARGKTRKAQTQPDRETP